MMEFTRKLAFAAVGISLCVVPVTTVGASPVTAVSQPVAASQTVSPWLALSAMTTASSSATVAATAAAATAAQDDEGGYSSPWPAYVVIGLTVILGIYIAAKGSDSDDIDVVVPPPVVSPV